MSSISPKRNIINEIVLKKPVPKKPLANFLLRQYIREVSDVTVPFSKLPFLNKSSSRKDTKKIENNKLVQKILLKELGRFRKK